MPDVEIYTQPWCPYCARALALLKRKSVPFREIHAPHGSAEREQAIARSGGQLTVPQIFIDGASIGGCEELVHLERSGKLDAALGIAAKHAV